MANVLIFSQDVIGSSMAGPGIRYWEFAKALSVHHRVTLAAPNTPDISSDQFSIVSYETGRLDSVYQGHDVIITQNVLPVLAAFAKKHGTRIILDAYDPMLLENLEIFSGESQSAQRGKNRRAFRELHLAMLAADNVICASEKQRDLWLGTLMAFDRITPAEYARDISLRQLIDVVPFGLQDESPKHTQDGFRKKLGIKESDKVLIWGGGIWNWFDPLTLIKAVAKIAEKRSDVKLVFMGLKHPNNDVPEMAMATKAVELAKELDVLDKAVFFNFGWVPYNERQNHLLEADIGVSTHFDHLETRFSFRTRILDYFWAGLPIVATKGDSMAELITQDKLGIAVDYEDVDGLAKAILTLLDDKALYKQSKDNIAAIRQRFAWSQVVAPINSMIAQGPPVARSDSRAQFQARMTMYTAILGDAYRQKGLGHVVSKIIHRALRPLGLR